MALDMSFAGIRKRIAALEQVKFTLLRTLNDHHRALVDHRIINANAHKEILKRLDDLEARMHALEADDR